MNAFQIKEKTNRWLRNNYKAIIKKNESVSVNVEAFDTFPKLIWRQTASYPIVAVDEEGVAFGRSIQCGFLKQELSDEYYYYLALIMNSDYIKNQYLDNVKEGGKIFPQIKLGKLKEIIVPVPKNKHLKASRQLYKKIQEKGLVNSTKKQYTDFVNDVLTLARE